MGQIMVGTSGFSYADWKGVFYPPETPKTAMLPYYATQFPVVELDYTYYAMPTARTLQGMSEKTPETFQFCVKTHQSITHAPDATSDEFDSACRVFCRALAPLRDDGKLACVLAQFPWGFRPAERSWEQLQRLRDNMKDLPLVIEFRNVAWVVKETFYRLHDLDYGFCCVDEPALKGLFPPLAYATSKVGYIRFHGRNAAKWWNAKEGWERYNYLYSQEELMEWLPKIHHVAERADRTYVLMNNCHAGHAVVNACMIQELIREILGEDVNFRET